MFSKWYNYTPYNVEMSSTWLRGNRVNLLIWFVNVLSRMAFTDLKASKTVSRQICIKI